MFTKFRSLTREGNQWRNPNNGYVYTLSKVSGQHRVITYHYHHSDYRKCVNGVTLYDGDKAIASGKAAWVKFAELTGDKIAQMMAR